MKTIAPALAGHLESDATTTCHCWKVTLKDGAEIGFTDHDEALFFAGTAILAASDNDSETGLGAGAGEVAGGFSSEAISEEDLAAGRFDGARVELYLVNWQAPEEHVLLSLREIGDVVDDEPVLQSPKRYAMYFIDKLEHAGAVEWTGQWSATEYGRAYLDSLNEE